MGIGAEKWIVAGVICLLGGGGWMARSRTPETGTGEVEAFTKKFDEAILKMDNAAVMALWAQDGVTLLPGMAPIEGRKTIAKWMDDLVAQMPGVHVIAQHTEYHDIQVSGDWASEWGLTHQTVQPPDGKPVIVAEGKILLVLHKERNGEWRIKQEMWNSGPKLRGCD